MGLPRRMTLLIPGIVAVAHVMAACGASPTAATTAEPPPEEVRIFVATTEVVVGPNRLLLALHEGQSRQGRPISNAQVHLRFFLPSSDDQSRVRAESDALFVGEGIESAQALYSARASFATPGMWDVEASIARGGLAPVLARTSFPVQARNFVPKIGNPATPSRNKTIRDAPIEQLTSQRPTGDPDFYTLTIADALEQGKPLMLIFSAPAFCQTRTCGPQLEAAQALKQRFGDRMNFIHVEVFQRPDLLLQGEGQLQVNPVLLEWNLQTEPWVFIADSQGAVFDRFEGFASQAELERSVVGVLGG